MVTHFGSKECHTYFDPSCEAISLALFPNRLINEQTEHAPRCLSRSWQNGGADNLSPNLYRLVERALSPWSACHRRPPPSLAFFSTRSVPPPASPSGRGPWRAVKWLPKGL